MDNSVRICEHCGAEVRAGAKFCMACGAQLTDPTPKTEPEEDYVVIDATSTTYPAFDNPMGLNIPQPIKGKVNDDPIPTLHILEEIHMEAEEAYANGGKRSQVLKALKQEEVALVNCMFHYGFDVEDYYHMAGYYLENIRRQKELDRFFLLPMYKPLENDKRTFFYTDPKSGYKNQRLYPDGAPFFPFS